MKHKPTIYDVAAAADVSPSTVSRVINNATNVAAQTRDRVCAAIRDLEYAPDGIARKLAQSKQAGTRTQWDKEEQGQDADRVTKPSEGFLLFEGPWQGAELETVERAFADSAKIHSWLCVKTRLQGDDLFLALSLHRFEPLVTADTAHDLSAQIV